ncbi:MAG: hypothetical protein ACWGN7_04105, partial [Thermodesulfovibrionales bacterium]
MLPESIACGQSNRRRRSRLLLMIALSLAVFLPAEEAYAWHDETHLAVAKAAGYFKWYNAAGAD